MEKTITISGKSVRLKTSGAFPLRFKAQFHKDYFKELTRLMPLMKVAKKLEKLAKKKETAKQSEAAEKSELQSVADAMNLIDFDLFYEIVWTMAKTADPSIPEPLEWLDGFETFPIVEILPEVQSMMTAMIASEKNLPAAHQANR